MLALGAASCLLATPALARPVSEAVSAGSPVSEAMSNAGSTYDYLMLVQQWAITECQDAFKCKAQATYFTLHGLWPEREDGTYPTSCAQGKAYDSTVMAPLLPQLNTYWPSLNGVSDSFWNHEYTKHGRCAVDAFPTQLEYFSGTLSLLSTYNVSLALAKAGLFPSNTRAMNLTAIDAALKAAYGHGMAIQCDKANRIEVITQCVTKEHTLRDCPPTVSTKGCKGGVAILTASQ